MVFDLSLRLGELDSSQKFSDFHQNSDQKRIQKYTKEGKIISKDWTHDKIQEDRNYIAVIVVEIASFASFSKFRSMIFSKKRLESILASKHSLLSLLSILVLKLWD